MDSREFIKVPSAAAASSRLGFTKCGREARASFRGSPLVSRKVRHPAARAAVDLFIAAIAEMPGWDECWLPDLAPDGALAKAAPAAGW